VEEETGSLRNIETTGQTLLPEMACFISNQTLPLTITVRKLLEMELAQFGEARLLINAPTTVFTAVKGMLPHLATS